MIDTRQTAAIDGVVKGVNNYWYRAGIPRRIRRKMAEQLRADLEQAVEAGRSIEGVVGPDLAAFAAERAEAQRSRPLLDLALQVFAAATFLLGTFALLNPVLHDLVGEGDTRVGVPAATQAWARGTDAFFALPPGAAWALVIIGAGAQATASWFKRRG